MLGRLWHWQRHGDDVAALPQDVPRRRGWARSLLAKPGVVLGGLVLHKAHAGARKAKRHGRLQRVAHEGIEGDNKSDSGG